MLMAYRGFKNEYPENTMAAVNAACKADVDGVHIDVQMLLDKTVIVHRDVPLGRCENKDGHIYNYRADNFQSFSVGEKFSEEYVSERIPLMEDVVREVKESGKFLGVEISYDARPDFCFKNDCVNQIMGIIEKYDMLDKCYITSYNHIMLKEIKEKYPDTKVFITFMTEHTHNLDIVDYVLNYGFDGVHCHLSYVTDEFIKRLHNNGLKISVYGISDEALRNKADNLKIDYINLDTKEIIL